MTKTRIRQLRESSKGANWTYDKSLILECLSEIERLQRFTRRGEPANPPPAGKLIDVPTDPKKKARGTLAEIQVYAKEKGLTSNDAEWFWEKMEENEWKVAKQPVKDWKGRVRQWKLLNAFPSQNQRNAAGQPQRRSGPATMQL